MTAIDELVELRQQVQGLIAENERLREAAMTHDAQVAAVAKLLSSRESEAEKLRAQVMNLEKRVELRGELCRATLRSKKSAKAENERLLEAFSAAKASIRAIAALSSRKMRGDVVAEIKSICRDFLDNANQIADGETTEGCTPADARMLREANHGLIDENAQLRAAIVRACEYWDGAGDEASLWDAVTEIMLILNDALDAKEDASNG